MLGLEHDGLQSFTSAFSVDVLAGYHLNAHGCICQTGNYIPLNTNEWCHDSTHP